jgi:YidC/Oxa1 family membrane protein insertase
MERRLLLAILLTFVVLTAYQWMLPKPPPAAGRAPAAAPGASTSAPSAAGTGSQASTTSHSEATPAPPSQPVIGEGAERTIVVDNGVVHAVFSNRGATLLHWELMQYHDAGGHALDLVPQDVPAELPKPFALTVGDATKSALANGAFYKIADGTPATVNATAMPAAINFEFQDASGLYVRKQFRVDPSSYVITFSASVTDGDKPVNPIVESGPALGDVVASAPSGRNIRHAEAIYDLGGSVKRVQANALKTTPRYNGDFAFAGVDTHYFLSAAVKPGNSVVEYTPLSFSTPGSDPPISRDYVEYAIQFAASPSGARFFVGPKQLETLKATDSELVRAIWFGTFAFLSVPLLSALNWLNAFIGNYGWSIIVLTVLINLVMFPLRHKAFVSMRKMQEIQPQVKQIQDRYAKLKMTDPARQKMNTELMDLYRAKGVNPAGGCVPMLLPLPILFAFYSLLSEAIELRGAPFMLWIKDLSLADPYYVTPILMGVSQLAQQKMAPAAADRAQQNMMLIMPVMFTFFFLTSPCGVALYWLASNLLLIGQQSLTNYLIGPPNVRVPRPPAERRLKKAEAVDLESEA